jgi:hypothetical protein
VIEVNAISIISRTGTDLNYRDLAIYSGNERLSREHGIYPAHLQSLHEPRQCGSDG